MGGHPVQRERDHEPDQTHADRPAPASGVGFARVFGPDHAPSGAWSNGFELAEFYYNEGSYPQAKLYLEGIWKKNKTHAVYTMYYATCSRWTTLTRRRKLSEGAPQAPPQKLTLHSLRGPWVAVLHFDRREHALEAFMEALENLQPGRPSAVSLANAFIKLDELDMALATYERAEKLGTTGFDYELANLQGMRGDFEGMVDAYMALLSTKPNYLRTVQNSLNRNLRLTTIEDNLGIGAHLCCSAPFRHTPTTSSTPSCWFGISTRFGILPRRSSTPKSLDLAAR